MKPKILLTRRVFGDVVASLSIDFDVDHNQSDDILSPEQLRERARDCVGVMAFISDKIDTAFFDACSTVKVIANTAVGYNNIDVVAATTHQVKITNTPGVLDDTTADLTFALLTAAARRMTETETKLRRGDWQKGFALEQWLGTDIHHATLGIIGMGRIGQKIAKRAVGFEMNTLYYNRIKLDATTETALNARYVSQEELLKQSDFVVVMVPYSPATHHLIGEAELAMMKPTAIFINTARGGVADDAALIRALRSKKIAGAAIDVFENEPQFNRDFLSLDNVVLTPHIGSATHATRLKMAALAAQNLSTALSGGTPLNWVNRWA